MPDIYQLIVDSAETELKSYSGDCISLNTSIIIPNYNFDVNFCNERSVAYYISYKLPSILKSVGINTNFILCEFNISLRSPLLPSEIIAAKSDSIGADRAYGTWFVPDTYLQLEISKDQSLDTFVEFKNSDNYKYIALANDFLKYRFYTLRSTRESLFVFVIFNKSGGTPFVPSLLNGSSLSPIYQIISPPLSDGVVNSMASVFYIKSNRFINPTFFPYSPSIVRLLDKTLSTIDNLNTDVHNIDYSSIKNLDENYYYSRKGKFAPNVIESSMIQDKYRDILEIYIKISHMNDQEIDLPSDSFIKKCYFNNPNDVNSNIFTDKLTDYFVRQFNDQLNRIDVKKNKYAFKTIRRRSLWILLLIDKFSKDNNLGFDFISDIGGDEEKLDAEELRKILNKVYDTSEYKGNFNMLCLGLIFYIVNLYKLLYVIPENDEDSTLIISSDYSSFKAKKKILESIDKILILLDLRQKKHLDWNVEINQLGKLIAEDIIKKSYL